MQVRIDRKRKGKKIVKAPKFLNLYEDETENYLGTIGLSDWNNTVRIIPGEDLELLVQIRGNWYNVKDLI